MDVFNSSHFWDVPRNEYGLIPVPTDEYLLSYDGSSKYLRNQWMLFW